MLRRAENGTGNGNSNGTVSRSKSALSDLINGVSGLETNDETTSTETHDEHPPPSAEHFDVVIVGSGPSALILSYIFSGHTPYYDASRPHPDEILHAALLKSPCLLDVDVDKLTSHFGASRLSYSTQALPVNVLLDTLLRPLADTQPDMHPSSVKWVYEPHRKVKHVILSESQTPGGTWADNPVAASWDIGALSYAEMLSLPGYTIAEHFRRFNENVDLDDRPTRRRVAEYYARWPLETGVQRNIRPGKAVSRISRIKSGFVIPSHDISCKHLVLATGVFSHLRPIRAPLLPLLRLPPAKPSSSSTSTPTLLVVGSGFTAADVILTFSPTHRIIHLFQWSPYDRPSPLRACHIKAYPDYAGMYRRMKAAALRHYPEDEAATPMPVRKVAESAFFKDWSERYEGFPNTWIEGVDLKDGDSRAEVRLRLPDGSVVTRCVEHADYVIGRRGDLVYLGERLRGEVLGREDGREVSGQTLRGKVESEALLQVARDVYVTGSLTGDSLVRFAFGGCCWVAGRVGMDEKGDLQM